MRLGAYRYAAWSGGLVGLATISGVFLVVILRPGTRRRPLPFYSDATHADPERTVLGLLENAALALLPLVGIFERAQHERQFGSGGGGGGGVLPRAVELNSVAYVGTVICYWLTANTPTIMPWIPLHQFAASMLMVCFAVQASCKAWIARRTGSRAAPLSLRYAIATALWLSLVFVFFSFIIRKLGGAEHSDTALVVMACGVHVATFSCVALMLILARDLRPEIVVIESASSRDSEYKMLPSLM